MDLSDRPALVVDVGGGSVELIVGNRDTMVQGQSLKLGAIRLKDLYLEQDPPTKPMLWDMGKAIDAQLQSALKHFKTKQFDRLVGTSGMIGNLAEIIYLRRTGQPIPQLNLATVTLKEVAAVERLLIDARPKARLAIRPDRAAARVRRARARVARIRGDPARCGLSHQFPAASQARLLPHQEQRPVRPDSGRNRDDCEHRALPSPGLAAG